MGLFWAIVFDRSVQMRVTAGGQYAPLIEDGQWWRLVRSLWLHADLAHVAVNALAIVVLGRLLEPWIGSVRLVWWFVLGGVGGSIASHLMGLTQSDGASGGAFALLGALGVLGWRMRARLGSEDRVLATRWIPGLAIANLVLSVLLPFVDVVGHLGGLSVGLALGAFASAHPPSRLVAWAEGTAVAIAVAIACSGPYWPA